MTGACLRSELGCLGSVGGAHKARIMYVSERPRKSAILASTEPMFSGLFRGLSAVNASIDFAARNQLVTGNDC